MTSPRSMRQWRPASCPTTQSAVRRVRIGALQAAMAAAERCQDADIGPLFAAFHRRLYARHAFRRQHGAGQRAELVAQLLFGEGPQEIAAVAVTGMRGA